jgi:hypothetical protein
MAALQGLTEASFVPFRVRRAAGKDVSVASDATVAGVVLLADLSGFTRMAARLCDLGAEGVEALSLQLDAVFGRMSAIIAAHGGDLLKFAGDAVLVLFEEEPAKVGMALERAAVCALALVAADYASHGSEAVSVHVALAAGTSLFELHVGGVQDRWEYLITGDVLTRDLGASLDRAGAREATCPRALGASLEALGFVIAPVDNVAVRLVSAPPTAAAAAAAAGTADVLPSTASRQWCARYIPSYARPFLSYGFSLGELRRCTVAFLQLPTPDATTASSRAAFQVIS